MLWGDVDTVDTLLTLLTSTDLITLRNALNEDASVKATTLPVHIPIDSIENFTSFTVVTTTSLTMPAVVASIPPETPLFDEIATTPPSRPKIPGLRRTTLQ